MQKTGKQNIVAVSAFAFASLLMSGCSNTEKPAEEKKQLSLDSISFTTEEAPEWSRLFKRTFGWFGGDGIFAVTRDGRENANASSGSETLIWFSDTMLGEIGEDGKLKPGYEMIHNSMAVLKGAKPDSNRINFYWPQESGKNKSLFVPNTPGTGTDEYYWMGDGFVNQAKNNDLYIFGYRIKDTHDGSPFPFREMGNTLVVLPGGSQPPFNTQRQIDIPFFLGKAVDSTGSFGAGIFVNTKEAGATDPDGYVYVYGIRGQKKALMIARVVPASIEDFGQWRFFDGTGWTNDLTKIKTVTDSLSNELGMMRLKDGRYALVFQEEGVGRFVSMRLSHSPVGPFGKVIRLFDCSESVAIDKDFFPYNAKVHPVLSQPNELLISYNVNSFDFFNDVKQHPQLYRPRFVRVKINE